MKKNRLFIRTLVIIGGIFIVSFICKGWHIVTGGFKTNKIQPPQNLRSHIAESPHLSEEKLKIFDQEYKFLDKGCQVYVFESQDSEYVIKFLRHHKYRHHFWMTFVDPIKKLKAYKEKYIKVKRERIRKNFFSYLMSYEDLEDITQVVYVHLGNTNYINKNLIVKDRLGQKRKLDLDKLHYVVQRKGKNLSPIILELYKNEKYAEANILIDKYFDTLKNRCLKKVRNTDHSGFIRNMALFDAKVIEIDVGGYKINDELMTKFGFEQEFMKFAHHFKRWAKKRTPKLVEYIDKRANFILDDTLSSFVR